MLSEETKEKAVRSPNEIACGVVRLYRKAQNLDQLTGVQIWIHIMDAGSEVRHVLHDRMICDLASPKFRQRRRMKIDPHLSPTKFGRWNPVAIQERNAKIIVRKCLDTAVLRIRINHLARMLFQPSQQRWAPIASRQEHDAWTLYFLHFSILVGVLRNR